MLVDCEKYRFNVYAKTREEVEVKLEELIVEKKAEKKRLLAEIAVEKEKDDKKSKKK